MKYIKLSNSILKFVIDDEDFERASQYDWNTCRYGPSTVISTHINEQSITIGRFLLNYYGEMQVDHKDRNHLNCQKSNLRVVTHSQNQWNKGIQSNSSSNLKGVSYCRDRNLWAAHIQANGVRRFLGRFHTKEQAALAYNREAKKLHGEFAYQNVI